MVPMSTGQVEPHIVGRFGSMQVCSASAEVLPVLLSTSLIKHLVLHRRDLDHLETTPTTTSRLPPSPPLDLQTTKTTQRAAVGRRRTADPHSSRIERRTGRGGGASGGVAQHLLLQHLLLHRRDLDLLEMTPGTTPLATSLSALACRPPANTRGARDFVKGGKTACAPHRHRINGVLCVVWVEGGRRASHSWREGASQKVTMKRSFLGLRENALARLDLPVQVFRSSFVDSVDSTGIRRQFPRRHRRLTLGCDAVGAECTDRSFSTTLSLVCPHSSVGLSGLSR